MKETIREFSGKRIGPVEIKIIKWAIESYPKLSRSELAGTVCEFIDWNTPAGRAKIPQCLECLAKLEEEGLITLPPLRPNGGRKGQRRTGTTKPELALETDTSEITECNIKAVELEIVRPGTEMSRWNGYIDRYHMLGCKKVFGSRLQYFIKCEGVELGCLQFSASAWALSGREKWIGWTTEDRKARLHLVVNNSRFLIFPWIHVRNLASRSLSLAARQIQADWLREYCYAPVLMETFVDQSHFKGTCYKAANWVCLGETKGRGRMDRKGLARGTLKTIYAYPLQKDFRKVLKGEKPYKVVGQE